MEKKFRLRIIQKNYKYYLQYAYYYLWPSWSFIHHFYPEVGTLGGTVPARYDKLEYSSPYAAEVEARNFDTMEKVIKYIKTNLKQYYLWNNKKREKELLDKMNNKGFTYKNLI